MSKNPDWKPDTTLPVGKGATLQRFTATAGANELEIDTKPWGEGDLIINKKKLAHVENEKTEQRAFQDLEKLAEDFEHKAGITKTMKAAVVHEFGKPLMIEEVPVPTPGPGQILVKIAATGVCHTDLHAADGNWP